MCAPVPQGPIISSHKHVPLRCNRRALRRLAAARPSGAHRLLRSPGRAGGPARIRVGCGAPRKGGFGAGSMPMAVFAASAAVCGFWVGFWVLGFGFWVLGCGFWVSGFGCIDAASTPAGHRRSAFCHAACCSQVPSMSQFGGRRRILLFRVWASRLAARPLLAGRRRDPVLESPLGRLSESGLSRHPAVSGRSRPSCFAARRSPLRGKAGEPV